MEAGLKLTGRAEDIHKAVARATYIIVPCRVLFCIRYEKASADVLYVEGSKIARNPLVLEGVLGERAATPIFIVVLVVGKPLSFAKMLSGSETANS